VSAPPREPIFPEDSPANDNQRRGKARLPKAIVQLPEGMPSQIVEIEVLAQLLESLPPPENDNGEDGE